MEQESKGQYSVCTYSLKKILKSTNKLYKYKCILSNGLESVELFFGSCNRDGEPFEQYYDRSGVGLYTEYDNFDVVKAKQWYLKNKGSINKQFYSSKMLEYIFMQKYN
jgi:hypothetical protein